MKTNVLKTLILSSVLLPLALTSSLTFAAPFADFSYVGVGDDFSYRSSGNDASFFTTNSAIEIRFKPLILGLPQSFYSFQRGSLRVTGLVTKKASLNSSDNRITQNLDSFNMMFTAASGQNLLSMFASSANGANPLSISGPEGTDTLTLAAGQPKQNVGFTSDFLSFTGTSRKSVSLAFNLAPTDAGLTIAPDGFLTDFDASESGLFSSIFPPTAVPSTTPPVPEPETYALLLGGLGLMAFMTRRLQRAPI